MLVVNRFAVVEEVAKILLIVCETLLKLVMLALVTRAFVLVILVANKLVVVTLV